MSEEQQNLPPKTNGKSIASLVLGIVSLLLPYVGLILGIVGIVISKKAFTEIAQRQEGGKGMAVAGLVMSIISVAIYALLIIILIVAGVAYSIFQ